MKFKDITAMRNVRAFAGAGHGYTVLQAENFGTSYTAYHHKIAAFAIDVFICVQTIKVRVRNFPRGFLFGKNAQKRRIFGYIYALKNRN